MSMFNELVAGDSLAFNTQIADYSAADGWVLRYRLVPRGGGVAIGLDTVPSGVDHRVQINSTITALWVPGAYDWVSYVSRGAERFTIERGQCAVLADPLTAATLAPPDLLTPLSVGSVDVAMSMLQKYLAAEQALMDGKEVRLGVSGGGVDRVWVSEDLRELRAGRMEWERRVSQLRAAANGMPRFGGVGYSLADFSGQ